MAEFRMPALGADMDVGKVVEWRVQPGDRVHRGDIVAVVETEKATIEVEVFEDGTVDELLVAPGVEVPVGAPLARITGQATATGAAPVRRSADADRAPVRAAPPGGEQRRPPRTYSPLVRRLAERAHIDLAAVPGSGRGGTVTRADIDVSERPPRGASTRVKVSPRARRLAAERHLDVLSLHGTGPDGAVVAADVVAPAASAAATGGDARARSADRRSKLRASLGALMARSKREIPHYYLSTTIDMSASRRALEEWNRARSVVERILPVAQLLRAVTLACHEVPSLNGHWVDGAFRPSEAVHLGVAINLRGGGLVAPALRDAGDLGPEELMVRLRDVVGRARTGTLRSSEMTDPTITVTNLGEQGVEAVFGVIYPPQVALVGFGTIVDRPWAVDGMLAVRPVVTATLAADHRVTDGHEGARFLNAIDRHLQRPEST